VNGQSFAEPVLDRGAVKIVSYNVLGPLHGEGSKHDYAPVGVTRWTRRRDKLMEELRGMKADILCLQEVSAKGLKETFMPGLKHVGLDCCGFAPSKFGTQVKGKFAHRNVGCAIFARAEKFNIVSSKRVHLKDYAPLDNCRSHNLYVDVQSKWNSMAMLMLQVRETNQTICVANTHLYWNPVRADIKALQTYAVSVYAGCV
jgi:CCR4-NOT transcription complex subunit 6